MLIIDYFLPRNLEYGNFSVWKIKVLIGLLLVLITLASAMWLTTVIGISKDEFPFVPFVTTLIILIFYLKKTGHITLVGNLALVITTICLFINIELSGHIYSFNLKWLLIPITISALMLDFKYIVFWLISSLGIVVYFYYHTDPSHYILSVMEKNDYLIENIFFLTTFFFLTVVFYSIQMKTNTFLNEKNKLLEQRESILIKQKEELNLLANKLKKSNESLETYAYSTAHDLKEPVRTILSFAQLAKRSIDGNTVTEKTSSHLDFITNSASRLTTMIHNLLTSAKVDFDKEVIKEQIDLNNCIKNIKIELSKQIEDANVKVEVDQLPSVFGNQTQIECVFQNLISNAIKFSRIEVDSIVRVSYEEQEYSYKFSVYDNGIGIKSDDLSEIFNAFSQVNNSKFSGIGVGLSICQKIINEHQGEINVESVEGEQTTFYFTLPKH